MLITEVVSFTWQLLSFPHIIHHSRWRIYEIVLIFTMTSNLPECPQILCSFWQFSFFLSFFFFLSFYLSRAAPAAYGGSQSRGLITAIATALCQSHSTSRSEPHLQPTAQLTARQILNPLSEAGIEPLTSWFLVRFVSH